jgi:hypothetical protein
MEKMNAQRQPTPDLLGLREHSEAGEAPSSPWARISLIVAWSILLCGLSTAAFTAHLVYRTFSPVMYGDQWDVVDDLMKNNWHLSLGLLWKQHNEHRIPWQTLAEYADLKVFGGRNISLLIEVYLVQVGQALLLISLFRRYGRFNSAQLLTAAGFFIFCMFYPIQIENFYSGFQLTFVCLPFAACLSFGFVMAHANSDASNGPDRWWSWQLVASIAAAAIAETSLASGIFVWPFLLLFAFIYRMPAKTKLLIAAVGCAGVIPFLWGYRQPGNLNNPVIGLGRPLDVLRYIGIYFGLSWDPTLTATSVWPAVIQYIFLLAVAIVIIGLTRAVIFGAKLPGLKIFLLVNMGFLLLTSVSTALGRINLGIGQAAAPRYQSIALAFWSAFAGFLILWRSHNTPGRFVELQSALLVLVLASIPRFTSSAADAEAHRVSLERGWQELRQDPSKKVDVLYYDTVTPEYYFLRSHHLGPDSALPGLTLGDAMAPAGFLVRDRFFDSKTSQVTGFRVVPDSSCEGFIDSVRPALGESRLLTAGGWAWDSVSRRPPLRVLLVSKDGTIVADTPVDLARPDVPKVRPKVTDLNVGWAVITSGTQGTMLRAYAVVEEGKAVCALTNTVSLR